MLIGLWSDAHNFPNLPLMKISAYHKSRGDKVEFVLNLQHYDIVYCSKTFGDEYTQLPEIPFQADRIVYGGTGFAIKIIDGKEVYVKENDNPLPPEIENIYPDYSIYPELTKNTAYGFLTRGCPNNCPFCIVSKKEGLKSLKVADLKDFWSGQKNIKLLDANLLACKQRNELLQQLIESGANVDFTQGLDARFINREIAELLKQVKTKMIHFAFDLMKFEKPILEGLKIFKEVCNLDFRKSIVFILTNFNTTHEEDIYRVKKVQELGYIPDIRIYRKEMAPKITRDLQRYCNNRFIYQSCKWEDYVPRSDGKTIKELYYEVKKCQ